MPYSLLSPCSARRRKESEAEARAMAADKGDGMETNILDVFPAEQEVGAGSWLGIDWLEVE